MANKMIELLTQIEGDRLKYTEKRDALKRMKQRYVLCRPAFVCCILYVLYLIRQSCYASRMKKMLGKLRQKIYSRCVHIALLTYSVFFLTFLQT